MGLFSPYDRHGAQTRRAHGVKENRRRAIDKIKADIKRQAELDYHEFRHPGELEVCSTKLMVTARTYSSSVAEACIEINANPMDAVRYTAKGNLVAVITNGTAVLGLGNISAQASKPVSQ